MKKMFVYAVTIGLVTGVVYCLCRKRKDNTVTSGEVDKKEDFESDPREKSLQNTGVEEKMYQTRSESSQNVNERHSEAGSIMKDAYSNIMEDFVENFSAEKEANAKDENKEVNIDEESVSVMKAMDSISEELNDLLK